MSDSEKKQEYYIVTICYKSGIKMTFRCKSFEISNKGTYWWDDAPNKTYPLMPLDLAAYNVESIWYEVENIDDHQ